VDNPVDKLQVEWNALSDPQSWPKFWANPLRVNFTLGSTRSSSPSPTLTHRAGLAGCPSDAHTGTFCRDVRVGRESGRPCRGFPAVCDPGVARVAARTAQTCPA
jgi:hypothetical protein